MDTLRVGIVGCGNASVGHVATLNSIEGVQVVGLADPNDANRERMKHSVPGLCDIPEFDNPDDMYSALPLDAVLIVTPHTLHHPQIMQAVNQGLHVLCEKPLTCEPEHAREIEMTASSAGVTVMVSYQRRYYSAYTYMREAIREGALGELEAVSIQCGQRWKTGTAGLWRQNPKLSGGGMLMDSGSHLVDALMWLIDRPIESVYAVVDNLGTPVDINTTASVNFEGGIQGQIAVLGNLPTTWVEHVLVTGTEGVLWYEIEPQHPWRVGRVQHYRNGHIEQPINLREGPGPDRAWIATIQGKMENPAPPSAGFNVALLTSLIYRSASEGQLIRCEDCVPEPLQMR